jgi:DNA polymerase-3 subunit alpha
MKNSRFAFPNDQFYFKKTNEMIKDRFKDLPEAIDNTNEIVDKVELLNLKRDILLPAFPLPKEFQNHDDNNLNQWEFLNHLTYEGARERYSEITEEIRESDRLRIVYHQNDGFCRLLPYRIRLH